MPYQRATATTPKDKKRISDRAVITGNFNINYSNYEIHIPNYQFGKPVTLTGAGGLIAACIGKRLLYSFIFSFFFFIMQ
jgi:hypothetical protein